MKRSHFVVLCIGGYLLGAGYGASFLIPQYVSTFGGDAALAGQIIGSATLGTIIVVLLSGHFADKFGLIQCCTYSSILMVCSMALFASNHDVVVLQIAGLLLGTGWGLFYCLGVVLLAAVIPKSRRTHAFALLSGMQMAGIGTGSLIGYCVTAFGQSIAYAFVITACMAGATLLLYSYLSQVVKTTNIIANKVSAAAVAAVLRAQARYPIIIVSIGGGIFGSFSTFQADFAHSHQQQYGVFFICFVIAVIVGRLLLSGIVTKRDPLIAALLLSTLVLVAMLMFAWFINNIIWYATASILYGLGYGLLYSVINGQVANESPSQCVPQAIALFSMGYFIGLFGMPFIAGIVIVGAGIPVMVWLMVALAGANVVITSYRLIAHRPHQY